MKKRFFAALLSALILASASCVSLTANAVELTDENTVAASAAAADIEASTESSGDYLYYVRADVKDGSIAVSQYNGTAKNVTIPSSLDGKKVTKVGKWLFGINPSNIQTVTLPNTINYIEGYAFDECTNLTKVNIQNGVTTIGQCTFYGCTSLEEITIPDSVTKIDYWCFENCSKLKKVTLPKNLTEISGSLFQGCSSLTEITIPDKVTDIKYYAFADCPNLKKVVIPRSVTSIEAAVYAFDNSPNVTIYGYSGSYAEIFAKENNIPFVAISESKPSTKTVVGDADSDGEITTADALFILRSIVGLEKADKKTADVDGDGQITSNDALLILRYIVGYKDKTNIGKTV